MAKVAWFVYPNMVSKCKKKRSRLGVIKCQRFVFAPKGNKVINFGYSFDEDEYDVDDEKSVVKKQVGKVHVVPEVPVVPVVAEVYDVADADQVPVMAVTNVTEEAKVDDVVNDINPTTPINLPSFVNEYYPIAEQVVEPSDILNVTVNATNIPSTLSTITFSGEPVVESSIPHPIEPRPETPKQIELPLVVPDSPIEIKKMRTLNISTGTTTISNARYIQMRKKETAVIEKVKQLAEYEQFLINKNMEIDYSNQKLIKDVNDAMNELMNAETAKRNQMFFEYKTAIEQERQASNNLINELNWMREVERERIKRENQYQAMQSPEFVEEEMRRNEEQIFLKCKLEEESRRQSLYYAGNYDLTESKIELMEVEPAITVRSAFECDHDLKMEKEQREQREKELQFRGEEEEQERHKRQQDEENYQNLLKRLAEEKMLKEEEERKRKADEDLHDAIGRENGTLPSTARIHDLECLKPATRIAEASQELWTIPEVDETEPAPLATRAIEYLKDIREKAVSSVFGFGFTSSNEIVSGTRSSSMMNPTSRRDRTNNQIEMPMCREQMNNRFEPMAPVVNSLPFPKNETGPAIPIVMGAPHLTGSVPLITNSLPFPKNITRAAMPIVMEPSAQINATLNNIVGPIRPVVMGAPHMVDTRFVHLQPAKSEPIPMNPLTAPGTSSINTNWDGDIIPEVGRRMKRSGSEKSTKPANSNDMDTASSKPDFSRFR